MSCWQGHAGPILSTASEEHTQKREVTREERRRYSAGSQEESLTHNQHLSSAFQDMMLTQQPYLIITV